MTDPTALTICLAPLRDDPDNWIAHCEPVDLIAVGTTEEETLWRLFCTLQVQAEALQIAPAQLATTARMPSLDPWPTWHQAGHETRHEPLSGLLREEAERLGLDAGSVRLIQSPRPWVRPRGFRLQYDLIEVLYGINRRLPAADKLKLQDSGVEDYHLVVGRAHRPDPQIYPVRRPQARRLSSHHTAQLLWRFDFTLDELPELQSLAGQPLADRDGPST